MAQPTYEARSPLMKIVMPYILTEFQQGTIPRHPIRFAKRLQGPIAAPLVITSAYTSATTAAPPMIRSAAVWMNLTALADP